MPGKGRRVASRQAQLGRRRRRQTRGPGGVPPSGTQVETPESEPEDTVATKVQEPASAAQKTQTTPSRSAQSTGQPRSVRARSDRAAAYNYVAPELRRIVVLAGILTVVLVVLAFFI